MEGTNLMGRLLRVYACPVCNYHIEDDLHEGGSGIDAMFLRNHYMLALCADCHQIVSVLVPNSAQETQAAVERARSDIVQMEAEAVIGDERARYLLPFFRAALDEIDDDTPPAVSACSNCGSAAITIQPMDGKRFDAQTAWIKCPRCEEGRLLVETSGAWD
jgi:DNA-directed RNA polymerase subunit RPC12/RpoP